MREREIMDVSLSLIGEITGRDYGQLQGLSEASVFELGIDSLTIVSLIFQLEEKLQIDIPLTDLDEDTFSSVRRLASHLGALQTRAAA
jgi:acyl carrier protein